MVKETFLDLHKGGYLDFLIIMYLEGSVDPINTGLRWHEIRDAILMGSDPKPENDGKIHIFNMRLSRHLDRLQKRNVIIRESKGHKNTFYTLKMDEWEAFMLEHNELLRKHPKWLELSKNIIIDKSKYLKLPPWPMFTGLFDISQNAREDIEYDEFKKRMVTKCIEILEPQIRKEWEGYRLGFF